MGKRTFASVLWFLAVGSAWNYIALVSDLPSSIGLALGAVVAVLVWVDPLRRIWSAAQDAPAHETVASTVVPGARQART